MKFIITLLIFASYLSYARPMMEEENKDLQVVESYITQSLNGQLQEYLYAKLNKLWIQKTRNPLWKFVTQRAFKDLHPVLLYFVFRTYYEFAYAFLGKEIKDLPQNQNYSLGFTYRLNAYTSLMLFRIKSRIDTIICNTSSCIHEEFGRKFASRIGALDYWNQKHKNVPYDGDLTFQYVYNSIVNVLSNISTTWYKTQPNWICFCRKSSWSYVGLWPDTIYFCDIPSTASINPNPIKTSTILQLTESISTKIQAIAEKNISDLEKWYEFLETI